MITGAVHNKIPWCKNKKICINLERRERIALIKSTLCRKVSAFLFIDITVEWGNLNYLVIMDYIARSIHCYCDYQLDVDRQLSL